MNLFYNAHLSFEVLTEDKSGEMRVSEDQALYDVKRARKPMEETAIG